MFPRQAILGLIISILTLGTASAQELPPLSDLPQTDTSAQPASVLDQPIRQIADTASGCSVLDKDFPGLRQHSMYPFFKSMSLNQIAAMSKGQITADMLTQAKTDLTALEATKPAVAAATPVSATTVVATVP